MRLVVDTNVFVSAALKQVSWPGLVVRWLDTNGGLLKSDDTAAELVAVLNRPRILEKVSASYVEGVMRLLQRAELVVISERIAACRDPGDDRFLELAVAGRADVLVSGDADLLSLATFRGIPVVSAAAFVHARVR